MSPCRTGLKTQSPRQSASWRIRSGSWRRPRDDPSGPSKCSSSGSFRRGSSATAVGILLRFAQGAAQDYFFASLRAQPKTTSSLSLRARGAARGAHPRRHSGYFLAFAQGARRSSRGASTKAFGILPRVAQGGRAPSSSNPEGTDSGRVQAVRDGIRGASSTMIQRRPPMNCVET